MSTRELEEEDAREAEEENARRDQREEDEENLQWTDEQNAMEEFQAHEKRARETRLRTARKG